MNTFSPLHTYTNGNYIVKIFPDGSKVRFTIENEFKAVFPESIDIKITNYCDNNCAMCHEQSSKKGKHANFNHKFLETLKPGTELAIGGGNPLSHPYLMDFLQKMKNKGVICNLTVNQNHFIKNQEFLQKLISEKYIYGLGISIINENAINEILPFCNNNKNCVLHLIAGVIDKELLEKLYNKNLKILILGYKDFGRGKTYYSDIVREKIEFLKNNIINISKNFTLVSFDNLSIKQLNIEKQIPNNIFNKYYMGDDGEFTMYIDLVKQEFAISSTSLTRHKLKDEIEDMFKIVNNHSKKKFTLKSLN